MIYVENLNINNCQKDEAAFNRSGTRSSVYNQHHNPLSLMPPASTNSSSHESGVRSNSISSISGESVVDTEMSCTTPSPSSMPASSSTSNTLSTFNVQSQVNHPSTAASSAMVMRQTQGSPSSNSSSIMASSNASTSSAQHSFTLTPLGPHISSGYGSIGGSGSSTYFTPGCGSNSGSRFVNPNQQQHNFDGSFHSTWTTPFGSAGIGRTNYNGIPQFMSSQNQVFPGSQFQNNVVSNTEGSSSFFTHGSGGGGLISPSSNAGQNADRSSRGGDSNESSPHGVNSGSNSPHLSHGLFGHGADENHGAGGSGTNIGVMGGTGSRKREIRLIKNREAARECRRKKKEYIKCLENRVAVLENQNKALIEELKSLKTLYKTSSSTKMPSMKE